MEIQNIIKSANYLEFVNRLDDLINELLYSKESGFINLTSKNAIDGANSIIEKFNSEADKIIREFKVSDTDVIFHDKQNELMNLVKKHYDSQVYVWINQVFNHTVDNCILKISLDNKNKELKDKMYSNIISAISWLSSALEITNDKQKKILSNINSRFIDALNTNYKNFIPLSNPDESDCKTYLYLRNLIKNDYKNFLNINLDDYKIKLSVDDFNYFNKLLINLKIHKTDIIDEINLIDYALDKYDIKNNEEKYLLIKNILNDFSKSENNDENEKAKIIKRRINLYKNKEEYYKNLLRF